METGTAIARRNPNQLATLEQGVAMLAKAKDQALVMLAKADTVQETAKILAWGKTLETYARADKLGDEAIGYANQIKVLAQTRMGEMLIEGESDGSVMKHGQNRRWAPDISSRTIAQIGISPHLSMDSRELARMKKDEPAVYQKVVSGNTSVGAELTRRRAERRANGPLAKQAKAIVKRNEEKANKKERQSNDHEVKEFIDLIRAFREGARKAIKVAEYGKFAPEAKRFVSRQLDALLGDIQKVKEALNA